LHGVIPLVDCLAFKLPSLGIRFHCFLSPSPSLHLQCDIWEAC
jgi:hypothetical protein